MANWCTYKDNFDRVCEIVSRARSAGLTEKGVNYSTDVEYLSSLLFKAEKEPDPLEKSEQEELRSLREFKSRIEAFVDNFK